MIAQMSDSSEQMPEWTEKEIKIIALRLARPDHSYWDDLLQEGRLALWRAIQRHDPSKALLKTYAKKCIYGRMHFCRMHQRLIRVPQFEPGETCETRRLKQQAIRGEYIQLDEDLGLADKRPLPWEEAVVNEQFQQV